MKSAPGKSAPQYTLAGFILWITALTFSLACLAAAVRAESVCLCVASTVFLGIGFALPVVCLERYRRGAGIAVFLMFLLLLFVVSLLLPNLGGIRRPRPPAPPLPNSTAPLPAETPAG
jgi:hypothetical protein